MSDAAEPLGVRLHTLKSKWFWYSILCLLCWGPYALFAKMGAMEVPPLTMQFLFTLGGIPIAIAALASRRLRLEPSRRGISLGLLVGVLSAIGGTALFAAFGTGENTAVVTVMTGLYPMVTVVLAVLFLHERLTKRQCIGLAFAAAACILLSF
jgi:transporter family protein